MRVTVCAIQTRASLRTGDVRRLVPEDAQLVVLPAQIQVDGSALARACNAYVASRDKLAQLHNPDGELILEQPETFGHKLGDSAYVAETEIGNIGLLCGRDVMRPEVSRALALKGASLLLYSSQQLGKFVEMAWLSGLWREVQANQVFGVEAARVGDGYEGRSAVLAPLEMSEERNGVLALADSEVDACVLVAELDFHERLAVIDDYPIFKYFNAPLYRRELIGVECAWS
jgi:predicted amidohydrolase